MSTLFTDASSLTSNGGDEASGGAPTTVSMSPITLPVCHPRLASLDRLVPYLRLIDEARYYSNGGQLHGRLGRALAGHFGLPENHVCLASSGTAAMIALILAVAGRAAPRRPLCVCPDFTFVATAIAAESCGYHPYLADCDPQSWALTPAIVEALPEFDRVGLVLVVGPLGRMVDLRAWQDFSDRTGRPVIVDGAGCFDTIAGSEIAATRLPVMVSLHATKTFSTGEGGLILCGDPAVVHRASVALNFGFDGTRESIIPAINGKMSEYHAAVGLAELDDWPSKRVGFMGAAQSYRREADAAGLGDMIKVDTDHAVAYAHVLAPTAAAAQAIVSGLRADGTDTRFWYGLGLHVQKAFCSCLRGDLTATRDLSARLVGLPCSVDLDAASIARVINSISRSIA